MKLHDEGLEKYPLKEVALGNTFMIVWIALGAIACWFYDPIAALAYLAFAIIMVGIILRKLVCTKCYYNGKQCSVGWGKLSALFFKKGDVNEFKGCIGQKIAPMTYVALLIAPLALLTYSMYEDFSFTKLSALAVFAGLSVYTMVIARKKSCSDCKMKLVCKGSAAKS